VSVRSHGYRPGGPAEAGYDDGPTRPRHRASWADRPWRPGYDPDDPPTEEIPVIPPGPAVPDWSRLAPAQPYQPSTAFHLADIDVASDAVLTDESLVRHQRATPTEGWRLALYAASGGRINPGQSVHEAARVELVHRIRRPLPAPHRVAVVSVKGGVGKTTVAACLGLVLAELRGDRVVALDANPDAGTLAERLTGPGGPTVRDLYEDMPNLASVAELTRYTRGAGRLHVLGSEQEPAMGEAFSAEEYLDVTSLLERFYNVIITDSGTGMVHSAMEATLATADSLVVVGSPTVDGANRASRTLSFLADEGYRVAAEQSVVVLCGDRHSPDVDRALIRSHFAARCRAVIDIPPDPHLATGGRIDPALWRGPTRDAWYLLAAHVADGFGAPSPTAPAPPFAVPAPDSG
jgi:MinD-like ATPase involved in chromosome partitioning or flagellar assembly